MWGRGFLAKLIYHPYSIRLLLPSSSLPPSFPVSSPNQWLISGKQFSALYYQKSPQIFTNLKIESTLAAKKCHQHSKILDSLIKLHYMVRKYPRAISWTNSRLFGSSSWIDFPKQKKVLSMVPFFSPHHNRLQIKGILDSNLSFVEPKIFWKKSKVSDILLSNEDMSNLFLAFQKESICLHSQTWYPGMRSFKTKYEKKRENMFNIGQLFIVIY